MPDHDGVAVVAWHGPELGRGALRRKRRGEDGRFVELGRTFRLVGRGEHNRPGIILCNRFHQS